MMIAKGSSASWELGEKEEGNRRRNVVTRRFGTSALTGTSEWLTARDRIRKAAPQTNKNSTIQTGSRIVASPQVQKKAVSLNLGIFNFPHTFC
jgi:hypothetical protein